MKNIIYTSLLLFLNIGICFSQTFTPEEQHGIDSLNAIISNPNSHDTSLAGAYLELSGILYVSNLDTMIPLCRKIESITQKKLKTNPSKAIKTSLLNALSGAYNNIAYVYMNKGDIDNALEYLKKSLKIVEELGDKEGIATGVNNIGYIYNNQGNVSKALLYYHKSLKIEEELGNKDGIATSLNNIAFIYSEQDDNEKALEYYKKSLKLLKELNNKKGIASSLNNMGSIYEEIGDTTTALKHYQESLELNKEIGFKEGKANCLNNIGFIYFNQGDIDNALIYYYKSLKLREEVEDKDGITSSLNRIASAVLKKGNISLSKKYALQSLELSQELGYPKNIKAAAKLLSQIYEKEKNIPGELEMLKIYITMNDSINNEETQKAIAKQQAKYEYEKQKLIDDSENKRLISIEKEEKEKQKFTIYTTVFILVLVIVFLIFVFHRLKITRKQKDVIETQKETLETAHYQLEEKNQEILDSINYAKRIQSAILPPDKVVKEYLKDSFILYKPKDIVAGDFYWMEHKNGSILFAAADCTGHGVPGAMVSVVCNNALNRSVREHGLTDPGKILDRSREIVIEEFEKSHEEVNDGMDIAICTLRGNQLQYAGANNPLWMIRNGELIETKADKQPIGKFENPLPYKTHTFDLEKGDIIYIFSDGFVDQFGGENGKKFKAKAFRDLLLSIQTKSMDDQKSIIDRTFRTWMGNNEQVDDVCIIGVRI